MMISAQDLLEMLSWKFLVEMNHDVCERVSEYLKMDLVVASQHQRSEFIQYFW